MRPRSVRPGRRVKALVAVVLLSAGCARGGGDPPTAVADPPADAAVVRTATGAVHGVVAPDHRLFAGIPYARPPVGPLRWQPPGPPQPWPDVRDATRFGPRCTQDPGADPEFGRVTDENCLTLNVWTPPASADPRPVMVWIHGGGFANGSAAVYDARWLAARGDIVVVTVNYRLGSVGFLAHPALGPAGEVGNYGFADQQAALRWVRDNIADFGGDPGRVTLAGESAGGMSVCDHLVAPGSAGLFRAAIIQSAPCQAQADLPTAERRSLDYAAALGCGDRATAASCLRALPAERLRKPVWYFNFGGDDISGPISGTKALPMDAVTAIADGQAARVPILIGTNRDEFTLFVAMQYLLHGELVTAEQYPRELADAFGPDADAVAAHYPLDRYDSAPLAYAAAVTDAVFACLADRMAGDLARNAPVYAYEFNDRDAPAPEPLRTLPFPAGASHALELRYLFDVGGAPPLNPSQRALSDQMIDYWSSFVTTGVPAAPGQPDWPVFGDGADHRRISLQQGGNHIDSDFGQTHQCAFWAGLAD